MYNCKLFIYSLEQTQTAEFLVPHSLSVRRPPRTSSPLNATAVRFETTEGEQSAPPNRSQFTKRRTPINILCDEKFKEKKMIKLDQANINLDFSNIVLLGEN